MGRVTPSNSLDPEKANGNMEWGKIEALFISFGCRVIERSGSSVTFEKDGVRSYFHRPHPAKTALLNLTPKTIFLSAMLWAFVMWSASMEKGSSSGYVSLLCVIFNFFLKYFPEFHFNGKNAQSQVLIPIEYFG